MKKPKSKVEHRFQKEMFVPWCAIHNNISWLLASEKQLETSDGKVCEVKKIEHIHVLSDDALAIVKRLYNVGVDAFMQSWYKRMPMMDSMWFLYVKVEEVKNGEVGEG